MFCLISSIVSVFWIIVSLFRSRFLQFLFKMFLASQNIRPIVLRIWYSNQQINWISPLWVKVNQIWLWKEEKRLSGSQEYQMSLQYGQEFRILCKLPIQHFKYSDSFVNPTFWEFRNFANEDKIQEFFKKRNIKDHCSMARNSGFFANRQSNFLRIRILLQIWHFGNSGIFQMKRKGISNITAVWLLLAALTFQKDLLQNRKRGKGETLRILVKEINILRIYDLFKDCIYGMLV